MKPEKPTARRTRPKIVSVQLGPQTKAHLDSVSRARGMSIKTLLGRLIEWFAGLTLTEQSIVLGQFEDGDITALLKRIHEKKKAET